MKKMCLLIASAFLSIQLISAPFCGQDTVAQTPADTNSSVVPVNNCYERAQMIKKIVAGQQMKKNQDEIGEKIDVLQNVCDTLSVKVSGLALEIEKLPVVVVQAESGVKQKRMQYTIQLCAMSKLLKDPSLNGKSLRMERANDLYRYLYSEFYDFREAERELSEVQKIYPDAFIRKLKAD